MSAEGYSPSLDVVRGIDETRGNDSTIIILHNRCATKRNFVKEINTIQRLSAVYLYAFVGYTEVEDR